MRRSRSNQTAQLPLHYAIVIAALAGASCADGTPVGDGGVHCDTDLDCNDMLECTLDSCGVDNTCRFEPISERCDDGEVCETGRGCVTSASCDSDDDCDDAVDCTLDSCGVGGVCSNRTLNERCSAPTSVCDAVMGCTEPAGCESDAECDDSVSCTNDRCSVDRTCSNTPLNELCDEGAGERCNPSMGCIVPMPCTTAADCTAGNFCDGAWTCDPEFGCEPPTEPRTCDDSDDCTLDSCNRDVEMCVFACDTSRSECECPVDPPSCDGTFSLTGPSTSYSCSSPFGVVVNINWSTVMFTNDAGAVSVSLSTQHFSGTLDDVEAPVCPMFEASAVVTGGCEETYTISGTFSDADNFTGTMTIQFRDIDGSCGLTTCSNQTIAITGTRM